MKIPWFIIWTAALLSSLSIEEKIIHLQTKNEENFDQNFLRIFSLNFNQTRITKYVLKIITRQLWLKFKEKILRKFWSKFSSFLVCKWIIFSSILKEDSSAAVHMINQGIFNVTVKHSDYRIISFTSSWNWSLTLLLRIK